MTIPRSYIISQLVDSIVAQIMSEMCVMRRAMWTDGNTGWADSNCLKSHEARA